jgi:hypothetical protein
LIAKDVRTGGNISQQVEHGIKVHGKRGCLGKGKGGQGWVEDDYP